MRLCRRWKRYFKVILILISLTTCMWLQRKVPSGSLNHKLTVNESKTPGVHTSMKPKPLHEEEKIRHHVVIRFNNDEYLKYIKMENRTNDGFNNTHDDNLKYMKKVNRKNDGFNNKHDEYLKYIKMENRKMEYQAALEKRKRLVLHMPPRTKHDIPDSSSEVKKYYNLSRKIIFSLNYNFLLPNPNLCSKDPFMIMLVPSSAEHMELRRAIRLTHGRFGRDQPVYSVANYSTGKICTVFAIGLSKNETVNRNVRQEFKEFKDIILADFIDSYYNLTLKVLLGLKWIRDHSPGVQYVLKADDDVFVNVQLLVSTIVKYDRNTNGSVFGTLFKRDVPVEYEGKWGINNKTEYPLRHYPPYVQGTSYTLTGNLVAKIVNTAQYLPYLHIEDAFITGIIAHKIHGAKHVHIFRSSNWGDPIPKPCTFVLHRRVAQTKMTPNIMLDIWDYLNNPRKCVQRYNVSSTL